ncbi:MAG: 50S ribosomal protein L29 [Bacteroidia bacterium]|nr:50S ribosomal protein L29 [Bacteroidia bacterium]
MKISIVKELTTEEVRDKIKEERENYTRLKLNHAVSPIENPMKIRDSRRLIARLETELKERMRIEAEKVKAE